MFFAGCVGTDAVAATVPNESAEAAMVIASFVILLTMSSFPAIEIHAMGRDIRADHTTSGGANLLHDGIDNAI
jgi:hypothetical protein